MKSRNKYLGLAGLVVLAACNPSDEGENGTTNAIISLFPESVFSSFFVDDFAPFEAAAVALRTLNPLYTVQQFGWFNGPGTPVFDSYSIANARVEYAHAVGLTGAGQIISIVDSGFLQSHVEFSGKTIITPSGGNAPGVDDHGTAVASVAAGSADAGSMIGVAPGADLQLGSFDTNATRTAANDQARAVGAIVQNNSWGFEQDVTASNFQGLFGGTSGTAYLNSIRNLAQNTVIVFAASNDASRTTADILAALPALDVSLRESWLAVINAVPVFSGSQIVSGTVISAGCLEAAAWCLAADGSVFAADASGDTAYSNTFGSSFAAPQVSGAIALLAEAFPTLNAQELRARLLASADNDFFTQTGYVEFAPGVRHGFSEEFGHGFLNMRAALLPIGGSYLPRSDGSSVAVNSPTVQSGGMVGDTLVRRLAQYDMTVFDGLGSDFDVPASILTAQVVGRFDPFSAIGDLVSVDLGSPAIDPFAPKSAFSGFVTGRELEFQAEGTRIAMLLPEGQSGSFGLSVSRDFNMNRSLFRVGLSAMQEADSFAGISALLPGEALSGTHASADWAWEIPLGQSQQIGLSGGFGVVQPDGNLADMALSSVTYNSLSLNYSVQGIWGAGDRLSLAIGLPQAVQSGSARISLPVSRSAGGASFRSVDIPLAPEGRQLDLSVSYGIPLSRQSDIVMRAVRSLNDGNISGQNSTETAIGFRLRF